MYHKLKGKNQEVVDYYKLGLGKIKIAKIFNVTSEAVVRVLKKHNIERRQGSQPLVAKNPFEDLTNPEVQYWLGWLATDGCIHDNRITLGVSKKDFDILEKYCKFLGLSLNNISIRLNEKFKNREEFFYLRFGSKETSDYLISLGITPKKSYTLKINTDITPDFMRGIIEGDGTLGIYDNDPRTDFVTASEKLKNQLCKFLNKKKIIYSVSYNEYYRIHIRNKQALKFLNIIYYDGCTIYGNRKYEKFKQIKEFYGKKEDLRSRKCLRIC